MAWSNDNYFGGSSSRVVVLSGFFGRMNMNIHWLEDTARFEKAETLHALDALQAQESRFFNDFWGRWCEE